jgi:hypothetical protein
VRAAPVTPARRQLHTKVRRLLRRACLPR